MPRLLLAGLLALMPLAARAAETTITVTGGPKDATHVVCTIPAPTGLPSQVQLKREVGGTVMGQVGPPAAGAKADGQVLTFVLPAVKADEVVTLVASPVEDLKERREFRFQEAKGEHIDLLLGDKPVLRYINKKHDGTSADSHDVTFKPFHHVFDPVDGKTIITSGAYPFSDKAMKFPHHRGLFYGWKASYGANVADTWHGKGGKGNKERVYTEVDRMGTADVGPVYGRQSSHINWVGPDGLQFADEEREVTAYNVPGGTLIDFTSVVSTKLPKVTLDGDPQHAGFHFRAAQDVAKETSKQTVYTRPDGQDKAGATRNWPAQKEHVNLPWNAMTFTTGGKPYSVVMLDRPDNPKEARFSERDYGRFGSYFVATVTPTKPVTVRYRVFVKPATVTVAECEALSRGFVTPPAVAVK